MRMLRPHTYPVPFSPQVLLISNECGVEAMSLVLNHTGCQYQSQKSEVRSSSQLSHGYILPTQLECKKNRKRKRHHRHFINLSLLSNCVILKLGKPYVNNITSHMGFHKYVFCVFLTQQVFPGWVYKKCQDFKLKKTLKGQLSGSMTVTFGPEAQER